MMYSHVRMPAPNHRSSTSHLPHRRNPGSVTAVLSSVFTNCDQTASTCFLSVSNFMASGIVFVRVCFSGSVFFTKSTNGCSLFCLFTLKTITIFTSWNSRGCAPPITLHQRALRRCVHIGERHIGYRLSTITVLVPHWVQWRRAQ